MTKKLISTVLCLVMLVSVIGVSATPVTEANGRVTYTDNFNHDVTVATRVNYPTDPYTSDIFVLNSTVSRSRSLLTPNAGPDGSAALVFDPHGDTRCLAGTATLTDSSKWYEFSYDMKIVGTTTSTGLYLMSDGSSHRVFQLLNGKVMVASAVNGREFADSGMTISENTWYHVKAVIHGGKAYGYIYDDAGNGVCSLQKGVEVTAFTGTTLQAFNMDATASGALTTTIDNAKLVEYVPANVAPAVVTAPAINGNQAVAIDTNTVSVTLDQPLNVSGSTVTLTPAGGTAQTCSVAIDYSKPYTYTVTLPELSSGTSYTLDMSGLKNSGNAIVGNSAVYTFKTVEAAIVPNVVTSVPAADAEDVSVNTKTMTVTFNKAMTTVPETVTLTGGAVDITADVATVDNATYTFTWEEKLAGDTTYSVSLAQFTDESSVAPTTASLSFTTEYTGIIKITDDFEAVSDVSGYNTYSASGGVHNPNIPLTTGSPYMLGYVASVTGYNGNALKLSTGGDNSRNCIGSLQTAASYTPETSVVNGETVYEKFVMTYRINLDDIADYGTTVHLKDNDAAEYTTKGARVQIGAASGAMRFATTIAVIQSDADGKAYIGVNGASEASRKEMLEDHWYNIVLTVDGGNQTIAVIDAEGENKGSAIWSASMTLPSSYYTAGAAMTFYPLVSARTAEGTSMYNDSQSILLDDFAIWRIKPWSEEHALTADSVAADGSTITMNFNQPVMATKAMLNVDVVDTSNANTSVMFDASSVYPDFCQQAVTVKDLAAGNYVLDYSGIKALSGAGFVEPAACVKEFAATSGENKVILTSDVTADEDALAFGIYNGEADSIKVYVAYYAGGELLGVEVPAEEVTVAADNIANVTVSTIDGYDAYRILVWNNGLQPLVKAYSYSAPVTE